MAEAYKKIFDGKRVLRTVSNFKTSQEELEEDGTAWINIAFEPETDLEEEIAEDNIWGLSVRIDNARDFNLQLRHYNGFGYYVPKGKRSFKNVDVVIKDNKLTIL